MNIYELAVKYLPPVVILLISITVGLVLEKLIIAKLRKAVSKTRFKAENVIISAFHRIIFKLCLLTGLYLSIKLLAEELFPSSQKGAWIIYLDRIFFTTVFFFVTAAAARIAVGLVKAYSSKGDGVMPATSILSNITKAIVYVIGFLVALQYLGISITPILTALGVGGLAVALALQDTLSNVFAGVYIILSRQIKPGDYIRLDSGEEGYVADITWRNTNIRMTSNNMVVVPNSKIASVIIINYYSPDRELSVPIEMAAGFNSDLSKVEEIALDVGEQIMKEVKGGVPDFKPVIRFYSISDYSVKFKVILRAKEYTDQFLIKHEYIKAVHQRFQKEGIEIPLPVYSVVMQKDENRK